MKRRVVHFEIGCSDLEETSAFYNSVFNWDLSRHGNSVIINARDNEAISGHINQLGPEAPQNYVTIYIETDSLVSDLKTIVAKGGEIFVDATKLPDGRTFAWFKDVAGNLIGLITSK